MRVLAALIFGIGLLLAAALSFPWVVVSMGFYVMGDEREADRWMNAAPASRLLDSRERRLA